MHILKGYTKQEISWMMYDWANSAHSVIIVTLLPIFFDTVAGYTADSVSSMSTWGYATSIAMLIVALAAPFLGVFGDIRGMRKKLFSFFMLLGVAACAGMAFTPVMDFTSGPVAAGKVASLILVLYIVSVIGFDASAIYYDAFLTDVTIEDRMDKVSTMGYGLGYIGGSTIPLLIFLIMNLVGVPMLTCLAFVFGLTAVWWLAFSLPLLKNCEQTSGKPYEKGDVARSIKGVGTTIKEIIANKPMLIYILSYFFYIDGVHTVISMATTYGTNLGLDSTGMMLALLLVQILGLPFCLLYIKCSEKFGARTMVGFGICVYMFICIFAFFMNSLWQFWVLAVLCATSQGGIQALSRSMYGKLIPDKDRSGEFFGFFDIFGKFSSIMGPALVGVVSSVVANGMLGAQGLTAQTATAEQIDAINAQSSHYGILSIIIIIIVGAVLYFGFLPNWQRRCRAAAAGAVLKPSGGNCAVLPIYFRRFRDTLGLSQKEVTPLCRKATPMCAPPKRPRMPSIINCNAPQRLPPVPMGRTAFSAMKCGKRAKTAPITCRCLATVCTRIRPAPFCWPCCTTPTPRRRSSIRWAFCATMRRIPLCTLTLCSSAAPASPTA